MPNVVKSSDFILIHGNGVSIRKKFLRWLTRPERLKVIHTKPILFNEDDHFNFEKENNNFTSAVKSYASWGYFDYRMKDETFIDGYQSVPVDWGINSERKIQFFNLLKEITGTK